MAGVDEFGFGPDVSAAISKAYDLMRSICANAEQVLTNYQNKRLSPSENARIASIVTAFGLQPNDKRQSMFITLASAALGLLSSKVFLQDRTIYCGTPEGPNQWVYVPKIPLGQRWAWRNYMVSPVLETEDNWAICQDPTHKGPRYTPDLSAFALRNTVSICAVGFSGLPPSGFPSTDEERAEDRSNTKDENQLDYWGRSLVAILMHELHHTVSGGNSDQIIPDKYVPPGFPKSGSLHPAFVAYKYAGVTALANFVQSDASQPPNTLTHNPDTLVYIAMAIWLTGNSWIDNVAKSLPAGLSATPVDQHDKARLMIREAMNMPHSYITGMVGTRFLS